MSAVNNKRIAKNTLMLYFRMLLIMAVSLYTVRVVLSTLGTVDYGLYNVVGGIVVMFSFLSNTMASASQRFFSYELGRKNYIQLKKTFSMTVSIYFLIALIIFLLSETIGLWFLNNKMTIPLERLSAANWVYQFAILSFITTMLTIPYNAAIIANERMKVYAYVSILEAFLKLAVVYILVIFEYDKLKLYAILTFSVTLIITFIYRTFCKKQFKECVYKFNKDTALFKEIINYSGWNLFGALSSIFKNQGVNILLNLFFGPAINAARGIAYQVNIAILNFSNNFYLAVGPQIIKSYSNNQIKEMMKLVFQSTKFAYFLLLILALPILLETNFYLSLWLKEIPNYTIIFTQLVIVDMLIESLGRPILTTIQASGNIKWYQVLVGGAKLLIIPIAYLFLNYEYPPEAVFYTMIAISILCHVIRIVLAKKLVKFDVIAYLREVILTVFLVTIISFLSLKYLQKLLYFNSGFKPLIISFLTLIITIINIYFFGISKLEKRIAIDYLKNKLKIN
jgi:O-antigen/teichoic acid export membrane protein